MRTLHRVPREPVAILRAAMALSLLAAAAHLWVVPEHLEEWWGYGTFFLVLAAAQGVYALELLRRASLPFLLLGVAGNLSVVILWLVTRTTGVPFLGPHAGEVEEIGILDLACTLAEIGIVAGLGALAMPCASRPFLSLDGTLPTRIAGTLLPRESTVPPGVRA